MKRLIASVLCAMMLLASLTACGGNGNTNNNNNNQQGGNDAQQAEQPNAAEELTGIAAGSLEAPIVLTSVGQSADMEIVSTLCSRGGIDVYSKNLIMASELSGSYKTIILAVGGSSKGLGAAGIDSDEELERAEALIAKAQELGIKILVMHTGGSSRRGTLSDKFITPCFEAADAAIVVSEGDEDGLMRGILSANGTPADYVEQAADALASLKNAFGM